MYQEQLIENQFDENIFKAEEVTSTESMSDTFLKEEITLSEADKIYGRIIGVSSDSTYKRLLIRKIYDKCVFGQRISDMCNTIIIRCKKDEIVKDIHVYLYGHLSGGISELKVGSRAEVTGKFDSRNRFMARNILVDSVHIQTQIEMADIMLWLIPGLSIFLLFWSEYFINNLSNFNINKEFLLAEVIAFLGGFATTWKVLKKIFRYYVPFGRKIKCSLIGALVMMVVIALII